MNKSLKQVQWLVFWLAGWLPLALMAADVAPPAVVAPSLPVPDFPFTKPEFETLRDAESIDNQVITALAQDCARPDLDRHTSRPGALRRLSLPQVWPQGQ